MINRFAALFLIAGCFWGCDRNPQTSQQQVATPATPAPTRTVSKKCLASNDPEAGMLELSSPLKWTKVLIPSRKQHAYVATGNGADDAKKRFDITIVVGALGPAAEGGPGIQPPNFDINNAKPGLELCHAKGDFNGDTYECISEIVNLKHGFMVVSAKPSKAQSGGTFLPWPFIIRTPAVPAGPRASTFVAVSTVDKAGNLVREHVYRPSQAEVDCAKVASPDTEKGLTVVAKPKGTLETLTEVKGLVFENNAHKTFPINAGEDDERFLKEVCAFAADALATLKKDPGEEHTWECKK